MPFGGLLTIGLIAAGTSVASSAIQSHAVSNAANTQAAGTTQALNTQKQIYDTTRSDLSPYVSAGTAALGNLRTLAGLPPAAPSTGGVPVSGGSPGQQYAAPNAAPIPLGSSTLAQNPATAQPFAAQSPVQTQTSSGYVTMRAPDGTQEQVDQAHVARAMQLGGQVVN